MSVIVDNPIVKKLRIPNREDALFSVLFLFLLIVPIIFTTFLIEGFESVKYTLALLLTGAAILIALHRNKVLLNLPALALLGIFWMLNLFSTVLSIDILNSIMGIYGRYASSMLFVTAWILIIPIIWTATNNDEKRKLTLLRVILFQGLAIAVYGILQQFNIGYYSGPQTLARVVIPSFIGNHNFYSMYLLGSIAAVGSLWQHARSKFAGYYYLFSGAIILLAIVLAASRGALLGLAVLLVVYFCIALVRKYPRANLGITLGMALFSGLLFLGFYHTLRTDPDSSTVSIAEYTTDSRFILWNDSIKLISQRPILGTGHGNFLPPLQLLADPALSSGEVFDDAHNIVLHLAATLGLPALIAFLVLIGFSVYNAWRLTLTKESSGLWAIATLAGTLVAACFNPVTISTWLLWAFAIAFCIGNSHSDFRLKKTIKVVLVLIGVTLIVASISFIVTQVLYVQGRKAYIAHNNDRAKKIFTFAQKLNFADSGISVALIGTQIRLKESPQIISGSIDRMVSQHPRSAITYTQAGTLSYLLYASTGDEQYRVKMNQYFEKAEQLEPGYIETKRGQSYLEYKSHQNEKAKKSLYLLLASPSGLKDVRSWLLLGQIYLEEGNKDQALYAVGKAYEQVPGETLLRNFIDQLKTVKNEDVVKLRVPMYLPEVDL